MEQHCPLWIDAYTERLPGPGTLRTSGRRTDRIGRARWDSQETARSARSFISVQKSTLYESVPGSLARSSEIVTGVG